MKPTFRHALLALLVLSLALVAAPVASAGAGTERVLVQFEAGRGPAVRAALAHAGGQIHYDFERLNVIAVTLPAAAVDGIRRNPNVVSVEEDAPRFPMAVTADQTVPWGIDAVQARDVWDANMDGTIDEGAPTGAGIEVCIIDSGFYTGHEDLAGIAVTGSGTDWNRDFCGHGSHVAGTIAAFNNDIGVVGVTPGGVSLYIVKVFGDDCAWAYTSNLIAASEVCRDAGADIISMSLGGAQSSRQEQRQFDSLYSAGILSIAAAGNEGTTAYSYPASYSSVVSVAAVDSTLAVADFSQQNSQVELAAPGVGVLSTVPWIAEDTLTVDGDTYVGQHIEYAANGSTSGALVDGGLCLTSGSWNGKVVLCQRGDSSFYEKVMVVENGGGVAAIIYNNEPGNFLGTLGEGASSAIPAMSLSMADGAYLVANKVGATGDVVSTLEKPASGYEAWDGTSMATPHVSAVAALVWSAYPELTNDEVRTALTSTAYDLGSPGRDVAYGYGLVQAADAIESLTGGGGGEEGDITLDVDGRLGGKKAYVDLTWSGATSANVDIYLNGSLRTTTLNDGAYTDSLGRVTGTFTYKVCEEDTTVCSPEASVSF